MIVVLKRNSVRLIGNYKVGEEAWRKIWKETKELEFECLNWLFSFEKLVQNKLVVFVYCSVDDRKEGLGSGVFKALVS